MSAITSKTPGGRSMHLRIGMCVLVRGWVCETGRRGGEGGKGEDVRAKDKAFALLQANHDLRLELERSAGLADTTQSKHENDMAAVVAAKEGQQAELDRSAESLIVLSADYRQLES